MSGFTPGPWNVEEGYIQRDSGGIQYWQITDDQDAICCNAFCYAGFDPKVNSANAHLLAAAPDLLEALQGLEDSGILGSAESNASGNQNWEFVSKRINAARSAIRKATGAAS